MPQLDNRGHGLVASAVNDPLSKLPLDEMEIWIHLIGDDFRVYLAKGFV